MTKKLCSVLAALVLFFSAYAQKISFAAKAGWSGSAITVSENIFAADQNGQPHGLVSGAIAGVEARAPLGARFAALAGLQYSHKGYRTTLWFDASRSENGIAHLHYLNLPVAAGFRLLKGLSLQCGLEAGYLLAARTKTSSTSFDTEHFADIYKDFDLGILAGLEYNLNEHLFLQARWIQGVYSCSDIEYTDENGASIPLNTYNKNIQVSAGYRF